MKLRRLLWVALLCPCSLGGCSDDTAPPEDDEGKVCPDTLAKPVAASRTAVDAFNAYIDLHLGSATPACAAIIEALGGTAPNVGVDANAEELAMMCQAARQEVEAQAANVMVTITPATCTPDATAQTACEAACGSGTTCDGICPATAAYQTICELPTVMITGDATLTAALTPNLPAIAAVQEESSTIVPATGNFLDAIDALIADLGANPLCAAQRQTVETIKTDTINAQTRHAAVASAAASFLASL